MSVYVEPTNQTVMEQVELTDPAYPDAPAGLSDAAAAISKQVIWDRLEQFTNYKIGERSIRYRVLVCQKQPYWIPAERPFVVTRIQTIDAITEDYVDKTVTPREDGAVRLDGLSLVTVTVGSTTAPPLFQEAYKRLAEYWATPKIGPEGSTRYSLSIGPDISESVSTVATHTARGMIYSGAADLLRKYRNLGAAHV